MSLSTNTLDRRVYRALRDYLLEHGYPPNYEELSVACGLNVDRVYGHLLRLVERGYIEFRGDRPRSIRMAAPNAA